MHVKGISHSFEKEIRTVGLVDLNIDPTIIGLKGSPTKVKKTFTKEVHKNLDVLHLDGKASAKKVAEILLDMNFIGK